MPYNHQHKYFFLGVFFEESHLKWIEQLMFYKNNWFLFLL